MNLRPLRPERSALARLSHTAQPSRSQATAPQLKRMSCIKAEFRNEQKEIISFLLPQKHYAKRKSNGKTNHICQTRCLLFAGIISGIWTKMVDHFCLNWKILPSSNGCKLMNYGHCFVNSRKYLCFYLEKNFLLKQKDFFSETNAKCPEKRYQLATLVNNALE